MNQPLWLKSPEIQRLLSHLVDKLDVSSAPNGGLSRSIRLDRKSFPALFNADLEETREHLMRCVQTMADWGWFELLVDRDRGEKVALYERNPYLRVFNGAAIREAVGRTSRPVTSGDLWRDAVAKHLEADALVKEYVNRYRIEIPGRSAHEIVQRLNKLFGMRDEQLLLREVSARLFWGQSKVLDGRQSLVATLTGNEDCPFPEMPVQLQVFIPAAGFTEVLFIENLATFEKATRDVSTRFYGLALVFASGFKGSAKRLRSPGGASIYFSADGSLSNAHIDRFKAWLWGTNPLPSWFWGDLDFSGMGILKSLRSGFLDMGAWEPGYRPMLASLLDAEGHAPDAAGKSGQTSVESTGCCYADSTLIPAMKTHKAFVDQEAV